MLSPQPPAEGIVTFKSYPDMKFFRVPCECSCDNEIDVMVEVDEDSIITVSFDTKVKTKFWIETFRVDYSEPWLVLNIKSCINDVIRRVSTAWTVLTRGYVEAQADVLLTKQQALNFSQTLRDSIDACEKAYASKRAEFDAEKRKKLEAELNEHKNAG